MNKHISISPYKNKQDTQHYQPRPNWKKCKKHVYNEHLAALLPATLTVPNDLNNVVQNLTEILSKATEASIPGYKSNRRKKKRFICKPKGLRIKLASKQNKDAWHRWKKKGSPTDPNHPAKKEMTEAKKNLRKAQRITNAESKCNKLTEIMEANSNDVNMFYRLIRNQRSTNSDGTSCLTVDGEQLSSPEEILDGWAAHFEALATPKDDPNYNNDFLDQAREDIAYIEDLVSTTDTIIHPAEEEEVQEAILKLNNNKSPDYLGLTAEHFKLGQNHLRRIVTDIVNCIFQQKMIPSILKMGTITPVFKKGDIQCPDNYRGITVTSVFLKIIEHILNKRHKRVLLPTQSRLQTGFTKGTSSTVSALLVTECQQEAKATGQELFLITLDTRKAFDVVNHDILLRNLFLDNIPLAEWALLQNMYTNMHSNVQWKGEKSDSFTINQGVRQGGVLSTEHYKRFNNPLLLKLENDYEGAKIGNITIPHTTCADDLALLSHSTWETKLMLKTVEDFSQNHRYDINATKSSCIFHNPKKKVEPQTLHLNGAEIPYVSNTTHLGVQRDQKGKVVVEKKINLGRRTAYSLLGAGFHGRTGLKQDVKAHIWNLYIIPRMLFGIETLPYTDSDLKKLDKFQTKTLKQIQHLPDRAANVASNALMGTIPPSAQIHKNTLNLFYSVIQNSDSTAYNVMERQLAVKTITDPSFLSRARRLLLLYDLPDEYSLLSSVPTKSAWKKTLTDAVNAHVEEQWKNQISEKTSLKYLNPESVKAGSAHHVYSTVRQNTEDVKRAEIKARLLTGTYTLQSNRASFNQYRVDPTCRLCNTEAETRDHFISRCTSTEDLRMKYRASLAAILPRSPIYDPAYITRDNDQFTQLMLDCTHPSCRCENLTQTNIEEIELLSRQFLAILHRRRCVQLAQLDS